MAYRGCLGGFLDNFLIAGMVFGWDGKIRGKDGFNLDSVVGGGVIYQASRSGWPKF